MLSARRRLPIATHRGVPPPGRRVLERQPERSFGVAAHARGSVGPAERPQHIRRAQRHEPTSGVRRRYFGMLRGDDPRSLYREIKKTGSEKIDGREHTVLQMVPTEGKPDTWLVDADGTIARIDTALPAPESADAGFGLADLMPTTLTFANWQKVPGGRFPMLRTLRMGPATVTTTIDKAVVGIELEAAQFEPPAAVAKVATAPVEPAFGPVGKPIYQVIEWQAQPVASIRIKVRWKTQLFAPIE